MLRRPVPGGGLYRLRRRHLPDTAGVFQAANAGGFSDAFVAKIVRDVTPATCSYTIVAGPPKHIDFTVQDTGSGIASIATVSLVNMVTPIPVPAFTVGTTAPVSFTATRPTRPSEPPSRW